MNTNKYTNHSQAFRKILHSNIFQMRFNFLHIFSISKFWPIISSFNWQSNKDEFKDFAFFFENHARTNKQLTQIYTNTCTHIHKQKKKSFHLMKIYLLDQTNCLKASIITSLSCVKIIEDASVNFHRIFF